MSSRARNLTFKLVLLGDGRVGKTSLVLRYVNNVFSEKQETTVQASYLTKRLVIGGVPITLSIWDTAGQERFHALGPIYYRDADGMYLINTTALLVYDITDSDTFLRVRKWVKELQQMASKDIVMVIAANKSDLIRSKKYDIQEAESYATTIGAKLFLTSAKFGTGINDVFLDIAARLLQKKKSSFQGLSPALPRKGIIVVDDEPEREPPPKCCS
ncbi:Ras family [Musa troglodytarum]|uniref:Ras-related protein Rab-21 n=1 Tax=Musa troglodytarum TaxID=320322 RepID=A0A9E7K950_9LILI|nr:Ras family [Musa troglodytarum]